MDFGDYLHHIRTKPHHVRQRIVFIATASITFFVFLFWLSYASNNIPLMATLFGNDKKGAVVAVANEDVSARQRHTAAAADAAPLEVFGGALHTFTEVKNTAFSIGAAVGALFTGPTYTAPASTTPVEVDVIVPGRAAY